MPRHRTEGSASVGLDFTRRMIVSPADGNGQFLGQSRTRFTASRHAERTLQGFQTGRGSSVGIDEFRESLAEDGAAAARADALESTDNQSRDERSATKRQISDGPAIPAVDPLPNVQPRVPGAEFQQMELDLLGKLNRKHLDERAGDRALDARIRSFETAFGMQREAPEAFDFSKETDETLKLYGVDRGATSGFGWQCLVARRLAERGVRFLELIDVGSSNNWDSHGNMADHDRLAKAIDRPIAGLLADLKRRGMLERTLVVWTTEFGRTPFHEQAGHPGREHHNLCFTSWLAGGGVKGGIAHGNSDEHGILAAEGKVHTHDLHATMLHLLGIDHEKLTYRYAGRDYRLTDVAGEVVKPILA